MFTSWIEKAMNSTETESTTGSEGKPKITTTAEERLALAKLFKQWLRKLFNINGTG